MKPIHFERNVKDIEKIKRFYSKIFSWQFLQLNKENYWIIKTGEGPGIDGGLLKSEFSSSSYITVIEVQDIESTIAKIQSLKGELLIPKREIRGLGTIAYCKDPEGNIFGIMQK